MIEKYELKVIATIKSDFKSKFGIPRQSGLVEELKAKIIFKTPYRDINSLRGLEGFSHIWLIWQFSEISIKKWSPTVRPPRLGGNKRVGVFATRSPFRPNAIGLSSVKLEKIEYDSEWGPILHVSGADLLDGTPIYDIKPYLPHVDSHIEATGGFTEVYSQETIRVVIEEKWLERVPLHKRQALIKVLAQDPRPSYQKDPTRIYGMTFAGLEIHFKVENKVLSVCDIQEMNQE